MKGFFVKPIENLIIEETGLTRREQLLHKAGFKPNELFIIRAEIEDTKIKKLIKAAIQILDVKDVEFYDSYGKYWVEEYSLNVFKRIYDNTKNTKDFIFDLFTIHATSSNKKLIKVSKKLTIEIPNDNTIVINYNDKVLLKLIEAIIKHLSEKFKDKPKISIEEGNFITLKY